MLFLDLIFLALAALAVLFAVTQVVLPIKNCTPLFPILRSEHRKLEEQLAEAKNDVENSQMVQEIIKTRKKVKQ